jgi:hypothetical protein
MQVLFTSKRMKLVFVLILIIRILYYRKICTSETEASYVDR